MTQQRTCCRKLIRQQNRNLSLGNIQPEHSALGSSLFNKCLFKIVTGFPRKILEFLETRNVAVYTLAQLH
jgi:hypothetical protein